MLCRATTAAVLVATAVTGGIVALPAGAGAAPSGTTQGDIGALQARIQAGSTLIHTLGQDYVDASAEATSLRQQLTVQSAQLATLRHRLDASRRILRWAALQSYTGASGAGATAGASLAAPGDPAIGLEYATVASGNVSDSVDAYRLDQRRVTAAIHSIDAEQRANTRDLARAAAARRRALAVATDEQAQLTTLEARMQALAAAAASRASTPTQGLPVNGGLVKTATNQTSAPLAGAPTHAPPTSASTTSPTTSVATAPPTSRPAPPTITPPVTAPPLTVPPVTAPPVTTPPTTAPPTTAPPTTTPPGGGGAGAGGVWLELRTCESGDDYAENTGNGFYGAYQFSAGTWTGLSYPGRPDQEPPGMQDAAAMRLQAQSGWGQWPACAAALGLG